MKTFFYIADDVQELAGGKLLLVGLYADHVLVLNVPPSQQEQISAASPVGVGPITMLVTIKGLRADQAQIAMKIVLPDGSQSPQILDQMPIRFVEGQNTNAILKFNPLLIPQIGDYKLSITLGDGELVECPFEIRMIDAPEPAPSH